MTAKHGRWRFKHLSTIAEINPRTTLSVSSGGLRVPLYEMAAIDEASGRLKAPQLVRLETDKSGRSCLSAGFKWNF
jgi:hypothetical protein